MRRARRAGVGLRSACVTDARPGRGGVVSAGLALVLAALVASPLAAQDPGDPDGGPHIALAVGTMRSEDGAGRECCGVDWLQAEARVGWWLGGSLRLDALVGINPVLGWDDAVSDGGRSVAGPPRTFGPPEPLGPDTIRVRQWPGELDRRGRRISSGVRVVREVRSDAGFAVRLFGGAAWYWPDRLPMGSLGAGFRVGPQRFGLGLEYARGVVPISHRDIEWRYQDGALVETVREDGRVWVLPWSLMVSLEVNP